MDFKFKVCENMYLAHHGIRGQRWGVRRYQNEDGTLTEAGKRRYRDDIQEIEHNIRMGLNWVNSHGELLSRTFNVGMLLFS